MKDIAYTTTPELELALSNWLGIRNHLVVPNVSWGLGLHECDLLCISGSGYATEIEIKVSVSDLKRDSAKSHGHKSNKIKYLYFAMPEKMKGHEDLVGDGAGIIYVHDSGLCEIYRAATANKTAVKFTDSELLHLARLGTLRMWSLKRKLLQSHFYFDEDFSI